jgi:hypothetical protein
MTRFLLPFPHAGPHANAFQATLAQADCLQLTSSSARTPAEAPASPASRKLISPNISPGPSSISTCGSHSKFKSGGRRCAPCQHQQRYANFQFLVARLAFPVLQYFSFECIAGINRRITSPSYAHTSARKLHRYLLNSKYFTVQPCMYLLNEKGWTILPSYPL